MSDKSDKCELSTCYKSASDYYSRPGLYYNDMSGAEYVYFCSQECRNIWIHNNKCEYCGYDDDSIKVEKCDFQGAICYHKYLYELDKSSFDCDYCYKIIKNIRIDINSDHYCLDCFKKCKDKLKGKIIDYIDVVLPSDDSF